MFLPLQPNYVVCKYNPREDWISHNIAMSKSYEPKMSQRFLEMVKESGAEAENTAFVDCGVNIGVHSLFMAVNGVRIFGVDPLEENLLHVSCTFYVKNHAEYLPLMLVIIIHST